MGKIRCPLRPASMTLDPRPAEILAPPEHPPPAAPSRPSPSPRTSAKTRKSTTTRRRRTASSYARRTGAERTFATAKDPASNNIARGWTRLMGLTPLTLWLACLLAVRNQRILTAWTARQDDNARRAAAGRPRKPAAGAARPSPTWPQPDTTMTRPATRTSTGITAAQASQNIRPCPETARTGTQAPRNRQNPPTAANQAKCQTQT